MKGGIVLYLYTVTESVIAVMAGILIAVCAKRADGVTYSKLDKIWRVTNILLLLFYTGFSFFYLFLGTISSPRYDGFLGILGWIVSIIMASAALFCGIGLGLSVAFRKKATANWALLFSLQVLEVSDLQWFCFFFFTETCCVLWIKKWVELC